MAPALRGLFDDHVEAWTRCHCCPLEANRRHVVLFRGSLPCDVLFIGEAPGESEDSLGLPFKGPAGNKLDALREQSWLASISDNYSAGDTPLITWGITNIVACIPRNPSDCGTGELRTPHKDEAAQCQPRLLEIIALANPRKIVLLGDIAKRFIPKAKLLQPILTRCDPQALCLVHPSRILRLEDESPNAASLMEKKFVLALSACLRSLA